MATIVTTTDFRTRLGAMFDLADKGEQIFIKRRHKPSYQLAPIESETVDVVNDDPDETDEEVEAYFTPAMRAKIDRAMEQARQGMVTKVRTDAELQTFLESL
jgi:antitoxin (DNA-binding transcriptional repressor) of toxin-antitoxin stability system